MRNLISYSGHWDNYTDTRRAFERVNYLLKEALGRNIPIRLRRLYGRRQLSFSVLHLDDSDSINITGGLIRLRKRNYNTFLDFRNLRPRQPFPNFVEGLIGSLGDGWTRMELPEDLEDCLIPTESSWEGFGRNLRIFNDDAYVNSRKS